MSQDADTCTFESTLLRPADPGAQQSWAFLVLPKSASETLPRRGRTTVTGSINGATFQATLEPDGQLSHWLRVGAELLDAARANFGDVVTVAIAPMDPEPDPDMPADLRDALQAHPAAQATWDNTTSVARLDWVHWITSAKQATTRAKRIREACDKLSSGQRRVCCFDPSGFYSKAFKAPKAASQSTKGNPHG